MIYPNTKCLHEGSVDVQKIPNRSCFGFGEEIYRGICHTCREVDPLANTAYEAGFKFWQHTHAAKPTTSENFKTTVAPLTAKFLNETYKQLQEALVPTQTEKPYWIIVSDEGHANIPHKHFVKAEAEKEAQRLTELKPGITFTVFEAKSSVFTPKADTKKTVYADLPAIYYDPFAYFYGKNMVKV